MTHYCPVCALEVPSSEGFCPECGAACWQNPKEAREELFARMESESNAATADELPKIKYLLDALEKAWEREELPDSAYRLLTQQYLRRARRLGSKSLLKAPTSSRPTIVADAERPTDASGGFTSSFALAPASSGQAADRAVPPQPPEVSALPSDSGSAPRVAPWTFWVALVGAMLIIAAAAGFTIYSWPSLSTGFQLGILVAATVAFYCTGLWLRRRLTVVGISLLAVGAALVLIDGWFLLSAAGLHSLWWWGLLFAVGSAIHWEMGAWLRVRLFTVSGVIAQITWWWLLGAALSWPITARAAILSVVALLWTLGAPRLPRAVARSIGQPLGLAGPALAAGAAVVAVAGDLLHPGWSAIVAALVVAITATAAFELQRVVSARWVREAAAVALLPALIAFLALPTMRSAALPAVVLMIVAGLGCLCLSIWRGGALRAVAGLLLLLAAPCMPALLGHGGSGVWIAAIASWFLIGTLAATGGSLLARVEPRRFGGHKAEATPVIQVVGWLVLLGTSTVHIISLGKAEPLMSGQLPSIGALTLLAGEGALAWLVSTAICSRVDGSLSADDNEPRLVLLTVAGLAGYAYLQLAASLALHWISPDAARVWYSFVVLGIATIWSHSRGLAMRRLLDISSQVAAWMFGLSTVGAFVFAIAPAMFHPGYPGLAYVLLAVLAAAVWISEAARFGERFFVAASSIALSVSIYLCAWGIGGREAAGVTVAVAGAILALAPLGLRREWEWRRWWSLGAAIGAAGGISCALFSPWSATLALAALALALLGPSLLGLPSVAGASAFVAFAALCSLESWAKVPGWAGTTIAIVAGSAMLLPTIRSGRRALPISESALSLALAGVFSLGGVLIATALAGHEPAAPAWLSGGDWSVAVLLCILAGYCAAWSLSTRTRWGLAVGPVLFLAGLLVFLRAAHVRVPEVYFTVIAVWCIVVVQQLSRSRGYHHLTILVDLVALLAALGLPALLMMVSSLRGVSSTGHGIWLLGLGAALVLSGLGLRVRLYFGFGLGAIVLAAFWLTSSHLSAIPSAVTVVAIVGGALVALGAVGERRRASLKSATRSAFAGWR